MTYHIFISCSNYTEAHLSQAVNVQDDNWGDVSVYLVKRRFPLLSYFPKTRSKTQVVVLLFYTSAWYDWIKKYAPPVLVLKLSFAAPVTSFY